MVAGGSWARGPCSSLVGPARGPGSVADGLLAWLVGPARWLLWVIVHWCNLTTSQDPGELLWLFSSIVDVVKAGHCDRGSFNLRALKPHIGNNKGILLLFLF